MRQPLSLPALLVLRVLAPLAILALALLCACIDIYPPTLPAPPTPPPIVQPTPTPPPVLPAYMRQGLIRVRVDLSRFVPAPPLDYYALGIAWAVEDGRSMGIELSIRGTTEELCEARPCGMEAGLPTRLGLVARMSSDLQHDRSEPDEHKHRGEGINAHRRLALGSARVFDVELELTGSQVVVRTPVDAAVLARGASALAVEHWAAPLPPRAAWGSWWAREPWTVQAHGGAAELLAWELRAIIED